MLTPEGQNFLWIARVPETIKEAKVFVETDSNELNLMQIGNGYSMSSVFSEYGGIK